MSFFKVPNNIFSLDLKPNELYCYVYLNSIYNKQEGKSEEWIRVRQSTIAYKCNIKTEQTVSRILFSLMKKGYITSAVRSKDTLNGILGTYSYTLKKPLLENGFFFVDRKIFDFNLTSKQFLVYLFMCRAFSVDIGFSWNSYKDISDVTGINRSEVMKAVKALIAKGLLLKQNAKSRDNKKVYVDNHYFLIKFELGTIAKKPMKKRRAPSQQRKALINNSHHHDNITKSKSQGILIKYDSKFELNPDFIEFPNNHTALLGARIPKRKGKRFTRLQESAILALAFSSCRYKQLRIDDCF